MRRITVDLDDALYRKLKIHCAMEDFKITELLRQLLTEHLEKAERKKKK